MQLRESVREALCPKTIRTAPPSPRSHALQRGNVSAVKSLERMKDCEREGRTKLSWLRGGGGRGRVHYTMYLAGVIQLPWPDPGAGGRVGGGVWAAIS